MGEITLTPAQVRSAEILLKKSIPDLSAVELTGKDGGELKVGISVSFKDPEGAG
jgi:hypothetical protein